MIGKTERDILEGEFGIVAVHDAVIFIERQHDRHGRRLAIEPTADMVRDVLEACHGRLGVNEVRM